MIYLKWLLISLVKLPLLLTVPLMAVIISLFTRPDFEEKIFINGDLFGEPLIILHREKEPGLIKTPHLLGTLLE